MIRLWLFDIDGTLVDTGGAGMRALQQATEERYRGTGPELDLAGSTDLGVLAGILTHFGREGGPEEEEAFFGSYLRHLEANLGHEGYLGRVLPGVESLLESLSGAPEVTLGLLTGNISKGAAVKTRRHGLDRHFPFGAYGCDHADRNRLGPVALERASAVTGQKFSGEETLVIGDTPKDIACARAMGARCLAVATGRFTVEELEKHGPDLVVATLEDPAVLATFAV